MTGRLSVEVHGLEALQRKLSKTGRLEPVGELIKETVDFVEHEAERGTKPHPGDLGKLTHGDFIRQDLMPGAVPLSGRVFTNSPIVVEIDQGRSSGGRRPPVKALARWATRHGMDARRGFFLARAIARKGSKPVGFFKKAASAGEKKIAQLVSKAARRIESDWGR